MLGAQSRRKLQLKSSEKQEVASNAEKRGKEKGNEVRKHKLEQRQLDERGAKTKK